MRFPFPFTWAAVILASVVLSSACVCADGREAERWYVYRDSNSKENHGHFTNWMPAESAKMLKVNLADKTDPQAGATAIRVDIRWQEPRWAGVCVSCAPNFWGAEPLKQAKPFDLRRARKLVFHARGERGGESLQVKVAVTGDQPHGDSAREPAETEWITLGKGWSRHELSLEGVDLQRCVNPFTFVSSKDRNGRDITFWLDEIYILLGPAR